MFFFSCGRWTLLNFINEIESTVCDVRASSSDKCIQSQTITTTAITEGKSQTIPNAIYPFEHKIKANMSVSNEMIERATKTYSCGECNFYQTGTRARCRTRHR